MKNTGAYPRVHVDTAAVSAIGQAGGVLLAETARVTGLDRALSDALAPWRKPFAIHDTGKVIADLEIALALGGDALADIGVLRCEPGVFGPVASDATVSRTIAALAADPERAIAAINTARATARARVWTLAEEHAPDHAAKNPVIIDLDATLITAHSEKQDAKQTFKKGFGFHPLCAFTDHGPAGTGETLAIKLRPGNAGSNTTADHINVVEDALAQLPGGASHPGKKVLIRADGGGGTREFLTWLTGIMNLTKYPAGMRVIVRRERPHPGAQLRFEDVDGYRLTASATNTARGQLPVLELRHRRRARCEDRIRIAKETGLRNLPLHGFNQNRIWCHLVALATDLTAWMRLPAHPDQEARRWEPKRLRLRLFSIPAAIARTGRRTILHLSNRAQWAMTALTAISRLRAHGRAPG